MVTLSEEHLGDALFCNSLVCIESTNLYLETKHSILVKVVELTVVSQV